MHNISSSKYVDDDFDFTNFIDSSWLSNPPNENNLSSFQREQTPLPSLLLYLLLFPFVNPFQSGGFAIRDQLAISTATNRNHTLKILACNGLS